MSNKETDCELKTLYFITEEQKHDVFFNKLGRLVVTNKDKYHLLSNYVNGKENSIFILAFDNTDDGIHLIKIIIDSFKQLNIKNYKVALPRYGKTWSELIENNQLDNSEIQKIIDECQQENRLLIEKTGFAKSATDYFEAHQKLFDSQEVLIFEFNNCLFKGCVKTLKSGAKSEIKQLTDCGLRLLYSVTDDAKKEVYYLEINSKDNGKSIIEVNSLENLALLKKSLHQQRQTFHGKSGDLTYTASYLFKDKAPKVRALSVIGYDKETNWYFFKKFAYNESGKRVTVNKYGYFSEINIKPFTECNDSVINEIDRIDQNFLATLDQAYGIKGLLALGFYVSTLFSHKVFERYGFFPFLSLHGEPQTGKSFLSKLLNRCFFIDSEGQTMTLSNTSKGELRKISQKSSLVLALLEGRKNSRFDYEDILPLYNRNLLYLKASNSSDNGTKDFQFQSALSFVWNNECFNSAAAIERVISLNFQKNENNYNTTQAWQQLNNYSPAQLGAVGNYLLKNRSYFENNLISEIEYLVNELKRIIWYENDNTRVIENYAIALAGLTIFSKAINFSWDTNAILNNTVYYVRKTIEASREKSIVIDYSVEANNFFNLVWNTFNSGGFLPNEACIHENQLVFNFPSVFNYLQRNGYLHDRDAIRSALKNHQAFRCIKSTRSLGNGVCDAYHFSLPQLRINPPFQIF